MIQSESVAAFLRSVTERFTKFKAGLDTFMVVLSSEDQAAKLTRCGELQRLLSDLMSILSQKDIPSWAVALEAVLRSYVGLPASLPVRLELFKTMGRIFPAIEAQRWDFGDADRVPGDDYDAFYRDERARSNIPSLFDKLIE